MRLEQYCFYAVIGMKVWRQGGKHHVYPSSRSSRWFAKVIDYVHRNQVDLVILSSHGESGFAGVA